MNKKRIKLFKLLVHSLHVHRWIYKYTDIKIIQVQILYINIFCNAYKPYCLGWKDLRKFAILNKLKSRFWMHRFIFLSLSLFLLLLFLLVLASFFHLNTVLSCNSSWTNHWIAFFINFEVQRFEHKVSIAVLTWGRWMFNFFVSCFLTLNT